MPQSRDNRRYLGWLALGTATMALAMAVLLVLQLTQKQSIRQARSLRADSVTALAFQFEREFLRLRQVLDSTVNSQQPADMEALVLRYDIFVSRLNLLRDNPSTAQLVVHKDYLSALPRLDALIAQSDAVFAQPRPDPAALARLLDAFTAIGPEVQALSLAANRQIAEQLEHQEKTMLGQNDLIIMLTVAQLLMLLGAGAALMVRHRRQEQERLALQALTDELREANLAAESANRGKSQFLANMSHELRTPFNGMLGMLSLLDGTPLNAQQAEYIQTVRGSASHLLTLLNDILDVSALEAGKISITPVALQLPALLGEVDALMRPLATEKGLQFRLELPQTMPQWVHADGTRIKQIVLNLLSNAIKFSSQGEVALAVEVLGESVAPGTHTALRLHVRDRGIGMDQDTQARLFQRFAQGDASTSRRFGGTGLGLEISRTLARLMDGDITVDSQPGQGSVFTLALALRCVRAPAPEADALAQLRRAPGTAGLDILVAEDHVVNRQYMGALLQRLGHRVRFAEDGQQAVDEVLRSAPDLVLMDLHMPRMDGLQATLALRAGTGPASTVPIVALTADAFAESRERASAAGMNGFLSKPVRVDQIANLLTQMFGIRGAAAATPAGAPVAPTSTPTQGVAPPARPARPVRRRFRAGDVAQQLDMAMVGEVCVAVSLPGYQSLLASFFSDTSGSRTELLSALDQMQTDRLERSAHALKGAAASLGLQALASLARSIEEGGAGFDQARCEDMAHQLRTTWGTALAICQRMGLTQAEATPPPVLVPA